MSSVYDVVIVGAGLAGLSAAYALRDRRVLVLEREALAGGRVLTRSSHGVAYDLGAVFGFPTPHHAAGNGQLSEALAKAVGARLRLSSEVQSIEEKSGLVELTVRTGEGVEGLAARAVICATPGPIAARLIKSLTNDR